VAQHFEVHPENPQPRLLKQAAQILHGGGVVALPTDSSYALACHLDDKAAAERLRRIREVDDKHHLTLLCRDLSELAAYARVDNRQYRLLKLGTPGPYTFILQATKEVPRRLSHPSRRTIGLRVPAHAVTQALLAQFGQPLLATTLIPPGEAEPPTTWARMSTPPIRSSAALARVSPPSAVVRSTRTNSTPSMGSIVSRAAVITRAPPARKRSTVARPRPLLPPLMSTRFPANSVGSALMFIA